MEQQQTDDLDTAFSAPSPKPEPQTAVDGEASNSYFDSAFHAALAIGPQAGFEPNPDIVNSTSDSGLESIREETAAPPASQSVVVVENDKGSSGCVQFIDLTKDNEEVLVLDTHPRPLNRSRRTLARKTSTFASESSNDPDCPVVIDGKIDDE